jgi:hypothetical protein
MSTRHIASGNRDLVEWQYLFEEKKGGGHRGTRYSINWQLLELAAGGQFPVAYPLGETPPGRESAPFMELWKAFNLKLTNTKQKAKAAYEKLSPDGDLHATMVEAAARLHAHYEQHNTERRYRIQCHSWINARGWEDDLPIVYTDAKSAAIARGAARKGKPEPGWSETPPAPEPDPWAGDVDKSAPIGTFLAIIGDSSVDWNEYGRFLTLMLDLSDTSGGEEIVRKINHTFDIETERGNFFLSSICKAVGVGVGTITDTDVLHGKALECTITDRGKISYAELPTLIQEAA